MPVPISIKQQFIDWSARANRYFYQLNEFSSLRAELGQAAQLIRQYGLPDSISVRSQFIAAYFNALLFTTPDMNQIRPWYQRAMAHYDDMVETEDKIILYNHLMLYNIWIGDMQQARVLYKDFLGIHPGEISDPLIQMMRFTMCAQLEWLNMNVEKSIAYVEEGLNFAGQSGVLDWNVQLGAQAAYAAMSVQDFEQAEQWLQKIESYKRPGRTLDHAQYHYLRAWLDLHIDQPQTAYAHAKRAVALTQKAAVPFTEATARILLAQALYQRHEYPQAAWHIVLALRIGRKMNSRHISFAAHLAASHVAGDFRLKKQAIKHVRQAFRLGAEHGFYHIPGWPHHIMAKLCQLALEEGIEEAYVCKLIRMHHIDPADLNNVPPEWPWPVKLFCFGALRIHVQGKNIMLGNRQRRTIELLKFLLIHPDGVPGYRICDALWPHIEGDSAVQSLHVTQHRLRKLLGHQDAILVQQGLTSLNPLVVMNEMALVQRLLQQAEQAGDDCKHETADRLMQIYTGMLLASDRDTPWLISRRGQLHLRFIRVIELCVKALIRDKAWAQAELVCLQALETDDLNESIYYQLLCICHAAGATAKMHHLYRQYSDMLRQRYDIAPAKKIQALMSQLQKS